MAWMIYGANGYTGELVARRAVSRGERPVLAGRNGAAVSALAAELGLDAVAVDLTDGAGLRTALGGVDVVAHCAGPFSRTSAPMVDVCLATGTHYLDVTGEMPVFEAVLARDAEAVAAQVVLLSGAGFDVVPTDCLAGLLAAALPDAVSLELAFHAPGGMSRGTMLTSLNFAGGGTVSRVGGVLRRTPLGEPSRTVPFPSGTRTVGAITWGDVVTAYHSTGIGEITVYTSLPVRGPMAAVGGRLLKYAPVREFLRAAVRRGAPGPSAQVRARTRSQIWAEVRSATGRRSGTLTGPNAYDLTADAVVRAAVRLAGQGPGVGAKPGAHTPATAFGPDFVRELDGVTVTLH
jgi:saccharopine dehydrogenase (NAD+, L-lysine-forming)